MVSEPLLWPFLSSLVFISMTPFSTSLPPSQQPPQPLAVEPSTSSNHRPWDLDLQPPLRSFTFHRPLPFASPLQILLRLRLWRYHWDCLVPIYILVEPSTPSKIARAVQRFCSTDHAPHAPHTPSTRHCTSGFSLMHPYTSQLRVTRLHAPYPSCWRHCWCHPRQPSLHCCWHHLLASTADIILWL